MVKRLRATTVQRNSAELNQILVRVMEENGVESWAYSLDGYRDERQCMEPDGDGWQVYFGERGRKRRCKTFPTQKEAARELVTRLGRTEKQREDLQISLEKQWKPITVVSEEIMTEFRPEMIAAATVVFNVNGAAGDEKCSLLKRRLLMGVSSNQMRASKSASRLLPVKKAWKKSIPKESDIKTVRQAEIFGFKG